MLPTLPVPRTAERIGGMEPRELRVRARGLTLNVHVAGPADGVPVLLIEEARTLS